MKRISSIVVALIFVCLSATGAWAQSKTLDFSVQDHKLKNGLRVLLSEDHSAPTISIAVTYNVGSRDERPGRTGFAHLFEHMMFQGSENVGKGEHFILIFNNGGGMNGTTNADRTNYFETLPSNQLDLALFLEADRMRSLNINQQNLDNQREAVKEERRLRVDNQPYGKTFEAISETVYDNFAYKHSTIGSMEDLDAASVEDVAEFFRIYYAPNNAVLTLVGDFDSEMALKKVKKYFGNIPSQPAPPVPDVTEPKQNGERRKDLEDGFARLTRVDIRFKIPPANTPDWYALDLLGDILLRGRSSRLHQKLVEEEQLVTGIFGGPQMRRGPSMMGFSASLRPGKEPAEVERLIYEEIERVQNELVEEVEVNKIHTMNRRQWAQRYRSTLSRASQISQYTVYFDDPEYLNKLEGNYRSVTREDIRRVARTYLNQSNRTVITTTPKPREQAGN